MAWDNSTSILKILLQRLKVSVTTSSIIQEFEHHPNYPSLAAIHDVLNYWNVANGAFKIHISQLSETPCPCIAQLSSNQGEFVIIDSFDGTHVYLSNENWNSHKMSLEKFASIFNGNVLVAQPDGDSGETDYVKKRKQEIVESYRYPFLIVVVLLVILYLTLQSFAHIYSSWQIFLLFLSKSVGLATSILLLIYSLDAKNPLVERLCRVGKGNCNAILSSNAANINSYITWSEAGFFYFGSTWLALLMFGNITSIIQILSLLSLLCLPYTVYSIYYQSSVAKQWCIFCLTIQFIFWAEFIILVPYLSPLSVFSAGDLLKFLFCSAVPILFWVFIKPLLFESMQVPPLKQQLRKFKYNTDLFYHILSEQEKVDLPEEKDTIILGNVEGKNTITFVSDPFCGSCSRAHKQLTMLLNHRDDLKVQIVFVVGNSTTPSAEVARHLHQIRLANIDFLEEAINVWYDERPNFSNWKAAYPVPEEFVTFEFLDKQSTWCTEVGVKGTPSVYLNGYKFPKTWQLEDLKYLL